MPSKQFFCQGDRLPLVNFALKNGSGAALDVSAGTTVVTFRFAQQNVQGGTPKTGYLALSKPNGGADGVVTLTWGATSLDTAGDFNAEIEIDWNGQKQTVPDLIQYQVRPKITISGETPVEPVPVVWYAVAVTNVPSGSITATNVQAAIDELSTTIDGLDASGIAYVPAGTGAVATNLQAVGRRRISVFDYMTAAEIADVQARTELVDVRAKVQKAIDYASSVHGVVEVPPGIYIIGDSGSDMSARSYGLLLKSNCEIVGESARLCVFKTKTAADIDLLTTDRTTTSTNIALRNLTLDGNADGTNTDLLGFNAWILGVTNLTLENIVSQYPESWGLRIQTSSPVRLDNITCYHDTAANADGIHFVIVAM